MSSLTQESPTFPTEIFEHILSYSSHSTLLTTSAVNGTFHHITRKYMFNFISLKRTVYDCDTISRARTFLSLLDDIPDIANCVRRIHIDCFGQSLLELSYNRNGSVKSAPDTKPLITILSRLPKLNSISLRGEDSTTTSDFWLDWKATCYELRRAFARTFSSPLVNEINISYIYNLSLSIFIGCHSLKHLSFNSVSLRRSIPQNDLQFRPKLKSLILLYSFRDQRCEENLKWLFSSQGLLDVSQLDKFVFSGKYTQLAHILSLCGKFIKSLELKLPTVRETHSIISLDSVRSPQPSLIDLDILSNLTELIVISSLETRDEGCEEVDGDMETYSEKDTETDNDEDSDEDGDEDSDEYSDEDRDEDTEVVTPRQHRQSRPFSYASPLPWLAARLEMLTPASNLSEIILRLNLSVTDTILKNIDWTDVTRIMSSKRLPSLNLMTLEVSGQYTPLSPAQWAVLRSNQHLSPLVDDGRLVLVNIPP